MIILLTINKKGKAKKMKRYYERPRINVEVFVPNKAISACNPYADVSFDCLLGPAKDTAHVLIESKGYSCDYDAHYQTGLTKVTASSNNHSTTAFTWTNSGDSATGTATGASGLLYICANSTDPSQTPVTYTNYGYFSGHWNISNDTLSHKSDYNDTTTDTRTYKHHHAMVAPVYGEVSGVVTSM